MLQNFNWIEEFKSFEIYYDFPQPLREGIFIKRLNRFTGLLRFENEIVKVHIPNSGRLEEALKNGIKANFYRRKGLRTEGVLQLVENEGILISIDSRIPNKLIGKLLEKVAQKENVSLKKEVKINDRRIDFLIEDRGKVWIETKSITLVKNGFALFPDAPTLRGREHLKELIEINKNGEIAVVIFVVQREDAKKFTPHGEVDPEFSLLLKKAFSEGVKILAFNCLVKKERIYLNKKIEVFL